MHLYTNHNLVAKQRKTIGKFGKRTYVLPYLPNGLAWFCHLREGAEFIVTYEGQEDFFRLKKSLCHVNFFPKISSCPIIFFAKKKFWLRLFLLKKVPAPSFFSIKNVFAPSSAIMIRKVFAPSSVPQKKFSTLHKP